MAIKSVQLGSFCGGTSKLLDASFIGHEQSINMWPETVEATDSYTQKMLKGLEGVDESQIYNLYGKIRAAFRMSNMTKHFDFEIDNGIFAINDEGYTFIIGKYNGSLYAYPCSIAGSTSIAAWAADVDNHPITFCETSGDPAYLVFCRGQHVYCMDESDSGRNISLLEMPISYVTNEKVIPSSVTILNYRLIVSEKDSDYIYWSELNKPNGVNDDKAFYQKLTRYAFTKNDGTQVTFDDNQYYAPAYGTYVTSSLQTESVWMGALNNVKVDFKADNVVCLAGLDEYFIAFGTRSMQTYKWQNSTNCPYITTGKISSVGIIGQGSLCVIGNKAVFVGIGENGGRGVFVADGSGYSSISSRYVEQKLNRVKDYDSTSSFYYASNGHTFYVLTYYGEDDDFTLCYDFGEKVWHDRVTIDENGNYCHWFPTCCVSLEGNVFFGDRFGAEGFYKFTENAFVDWNGLPVVRERTTGVKFDSFNDIIIRSLELVTNNGETTNITADPYVMLQVSFDGGFTWSNEQWTKSGRIGRTGYYNFRTMWRNLGKGPKVAFRVKVTDNVPFNIATAMLEYSPCGNRIG